MSTVINTMLINRTYRAGVVFLVLWERMQAQRGCGVCPRIPAWEGSWKCSPEHLSELAPSPSVPSPVVPPDRPSSSKLFHPLRSNSKFIFSSKFPMSILLHIPSRGPQWAQCVQQEPEDLDSSPGSITHSLCVPGDLPLLSESVSSSVNSGSMTR